MAGSELEGMKMEQSRERFANDVDVALAQRPVRLRFAMRAKSMREVLRNIIGWFPMAMRLLRSEIGTLILLRLAQASVWMPILIPIRSVRLIPAMP